MKLAFLCLMATLAAAAPQTFQPGEVWPDDRDQHIQAHGGGIIKFGDTYYWFGEDRGRRTMTPPNAMSVATPQPILPIGPSAIRSSN